MTALYVHLSDNRKIGLAAATYVSTTASCPKCPLAGNGCYAGQGNVGLLVQRLNRSAAGVSRLDAAKAEATAIDKGAVVPGAPLRLHVSGDSATAQAARIVAEAARRYQRRGGGQPWTYTHAWRTVPREAWGKVSVLGSVESLRQAHAAMKRGYAPARIVREHPNGPKAWTEGGVRWIPCPAQTLGVTCSKCRLCFGADKLFERNAGIAFAPDANTAKRVLKVVK